MRALLFTIVFALAGSLAQPPSHAASEVKDNKEYGYCSVATSVDLLTDKERPDLICIGEDLRVSL